MWICIWQSWNVLRWPCAVDRMLNIQLLTFTSYWCACVCCQCNVVGFCCGLQWCWCTFHSIKPMPKTEFCTESSLFLSQNLSCLLFLCVLSLIHTLIVLYIPHSQLRIAVFNMCFTEPVQHHHSHSVYWPFTHMQTHSHSTDHSLIQCHYHRHTLSYHYTSVAALDLFHSAWVYILKHTLNFIGDI